MGKVTRLDPRRERRRPRRIADTMFTAVGSRLAPKASPQDARWFGVAMVVLPVIVFCAVFFA